MRRHGHSGDPPSCAGGGAELRALAQFRGVGDGVSGSAARAELPACRCMPGQRARSQAPAAGSVEDWAWRVREGLEAGRLRLYVQQIAPADGGGENGAIRAAHFEVLLRMLDESGATVLPGEFLPAIEAQGLAAGLDRWVVASALEHIAAAPAGPGPQDAYSINLSGQSIVDEAFPCFVEAALERTGVAAHRVRFELTETVAVEDWALAAQGMHVLKALGCSFSLDDFGTGHCSFAYLKNLPVDCVKIDGMFVRDIVDDPVDLAIVESINDLAHLMGMTTVAEYVESARTLDKLCAIGVDYVQGYAVSVPRPMENSVPLSAAA